MHSQPQLRHFRPKASTRNGTIAVLAAFCLVIMLAVIALVVDIGWLLNGRTQLQNSADAAALAACSELQSRRFNSLTESPIRMMGAKFAKLNRVASAGPSVDLNSANLPQGGVVVGYVADPFNSECPMEFSDPARFNTVFVRVERTGRLNGELPLFFARIWGFKKQSLNAYARASFIQSFRGFRIDAEAGEELTAPILPITIHENAWRALLDGEGNDDLSWDSSKHSVLPGSDGYCELNVFPQSIDAAGNFGLLDIGCHKSDSATLERQILNGLSDSDLAYHGGKLELNDSGELHLSGLTGQKIGIVDPPLQEIVGQTRIMPVYRDVAENGTNSDFTIVGFAGIRILTVELKTGEKSVVIQPTPLVIHSGIPSRPGEPKQSELVFSSVALTK